ncbi:hypothetical protein THAOC_15933, partial [Thalassiosira oceanica]
MDDEIETNHQRRTPADEAVPASCDGETDPPRPLALLPGGDSGPRVLTPIQQQEQLALGDEEVEVHESALSFVVEDSDRAPIPIQQQEQQLDDVKSKAKAEISTAIGAGGIDERDSTTELVAEERDEDLRPIAARLRVGASLGEGEEEEVQSMSAPRPHSGPSLCLADCDNDPPVPIQQQEQLLALDDKAVKNRKKEEAKAGEQKSVIDKTTSKISTAISVRGMDERDSTTEFTAEEKDGEINLRPTVRSGASLGELEARVEVTSMPTPRNDAASVHLAPDEEIPIYDGIAVPTERTRLQTWVEQFRDNYKSILGLTILVIVSAITVGVVLGGKRNKSSAPTSMPSNTPSLPPSPNGPNPTLWPSNHDDHGDLGGDWDPVAQVYQAKLLATDGEAVDYFGDSVAIYGDTVVVGAYGDNDEGYNRGYDSGSAHVFVRIGEDSEWTHQAKLLAPDAAAGDEFGNSVAIYGDTIVVGAYRD